MHRNSFRARFLKLITFAAASIVALAPGRAQDVQLFPIEGVREFPEATVPRTIQYACAPTQDLLAPFFAAQGLRFDPKLVRRRNGRGFCHIHYEPTLPGFRASPEDGTVSELFGAVDPISFVVGRKPTGDSLDVIKAVLQQLPEPVDVTLSTPQHFEAEYWPKALEQHFPDTRHRIRVVRSEAHITHPWAQDYVKAGVVNGERRILTPRRLFEGRGADGETFRPLLDAFRDGPFVRSKLSWEGGDLQFAAHPGQPGGVILFFGGSAWTYWGVELDPADYAYVLQVEFGADEAFDLARLGPHADYLVTILPADNIALLAWPVVNDARLAKEAAGELLRLYGQRAPHRLHQLARLLDDPAKIAEEPDSILQFTAWLAEALQRVPGSQDEALSAAQIAYVTEHCPDDPVQCFTGEGGRKLLRDDPLLWKRSADATADQEQELSMTPILLALIQSQTAGAATADLNLLARKEKELRQLGFRVIRVPHLWADVGGDWPGVSYINHLRVGKTLFVPALGLPAVEDRIFADLRRKLGSDYQVIPIPAQSSLVNNGGVHCVFGVVPKLATP